MIFFIFFAETETEQKFQSSVLATKRHETKAIPFICSFGTSFCVFCLNLHFYTVRNLNLNIGQDKLLNNKNDFVI